jgi:hypothetical protein
MTVASVAARTEHSVLLNRDFACQICENAHGVPVSQDTASSVHNPYDFRSRLDRCTMERLLLLWDDMDDWLSAALHLIGRRMA